MTDWRLLELGGVFLGGALPWLEAVVVVPIGIVAGLNPVAVVVAGATGNLLTVAVAAYGWERLRAAWRRWRESRRPPAAEGREAASSRHRDRISRIFRRWGLPGLALLGPIGVGTQLSAVVAVSLGAGAHRTMAWIGAGTIVWCVVAAVLAGAGVSFLGIGA